METNEINISEEKNDQNSDSNKSSNEWIFVEKMEDSSVPQDKTFYLDCEKEAVQELSLSDLNNKVPDDESDGISIISETDHDIQTLTGDENDYENDKDVPIADDAKKALQLKQEINDSQNIENQNENVPVNDENTQNIQDIMEGIASTTVETSTNLEPTSFDLRNYFTWPSIFATTAVILAVLFAPYFSSQPIEKEIKMESQYDIALDVEAISNELSAIDPLVYCKQMHANAGLYREKYVSKCVKDMRKQQGKNKKYILEKELKRLEQEVELSKPKNLDIDDMIAESHEVNIHYQKSYRKENDKAYKNQKLTKKYKYDNLKKDKKNTNKYDKYEKKDHYKYHEKQVGDNFEEHFNFETNDEINNNTNEEKLNTPSVEELQNLKNRLEEKEKKLNKIEHELNKKEENLNKKLKLINKVKYNDTLHESKNNKQFPEHKNKEYTKYSKKSKKEKLKGDMKFKEKYNNKECKANISEKKNFINKDKVKKDPKIDSNEVTDFILLEEKAPKKFDKNWYFNFAKSRERARQNNDEWYSSIKPLKDSLRKRAQKPSWWFDRAQYRQYKRVGEFW